MAVVRTDEDGVYLVVNGSRARPGNVAGYSHSHRMDGGGLKVGDKVKAAQRSQSSIVKVTLDSGNVIFWHFDVPGYLVRSFDFVPDKYDDKGFVKRRDVDPDSIVETPRPISPARFPFTGR